MSRAKKAKPATRTTGAAPASAAHARFSHLIHTLVDIEANIGEAAHYLADAHRIARDACKPTSKQAIGNHEGAIGEAVYSVGQALLACGMETRALAEWAHQEHDAARAGKGVQS